MGALGNGAFSASEIPVAVEGVGGTGTLAGMTSLVDVGAGDAFSSYCAVLISGAVDWWGYGPDGKLGNGTFDRTGNEGSVIPVEVG